MSRLEEVLSRHARRKPLGHGELMLDFVEYHSGSVTFQVGIKVLAINRRDTDVR